MKLDREFSFSELPERVRNALMEMIVKHTEQLVDDYDDTLLEEGRSITQKDKELLTKKISIASKITVKISAKCDADVLDTYSILPRDLLQCNLDIWGPKVVPPDQEADTKKEDVVVEEAKFSQEELESLEAEDAALYEKRKAAAKAVEEASG